MPAGPPRRLPAFELSSGPSKLYLEGFNDRQDLNFEIFIANTSDQALEISAIQLSATMPAATCCSAG